MYEYPKSVYSLNFSQSTDPEYVEGLYVFPDPLTPNPEYLTPTTEFNTFPIPSFTYHLFPTERYVYSSESPLFSTETRRKCSNPLTRQTRTTVGG